MIEELRVSLFAQDLRTALPVSEKRVAEQAEAGARRSPAREREIGTAQLRARP